MPSPRRVRTLVIVLVCIIGAIYYFSTDDSSQDFYSRTVAALDKNSASDRADIQRLHEIRDAVKTQKQMLSDKDTAQQVRDDAPRKAVEPNQTPVRAAQAAGTTQRKQEAIVGEDFKAKQQTPMQEAADKEAGVSRPEKSVAGRKTMKGVESKDGKEAPLYPKGDEAEGTQVTKETEEDHKVEAELNSILKKGSIIIFSKSYCPFSAKAKHILLEKYSIVPPPYVVELDKHELGPQLQSALEKSTGRRTVPNILVSGRSIGGGDEVAELDASGGLIEKIKSMAGKRIMEAELRKEQGPQVEKKRSAAKG